MGTESDTARLFGELKVQNFLVETSRPEFSQPIDVVKGGLNESIIFTSSASAEGRVNQALLRIPRSTEERERTVQAIQIEYNAIGATENGVTFRLRTPGEQGKFMKDTYMAGFNTIPYLDLQDDLLLLPYIDGTPLNIYVQQEGESLSTTVVTDILHHMAVAHETGVVFGDRWTLNTIVKPDGGFTELDFDIELQGEHITVASFELAQTLYHLIHFSGKNRTRILDTIMAYYSSSPEQLKLYNPDKLIFFLEGQADFFSNQYEKNGILYEGEIPPQDEVSILVNFLVEQPKQ